MSLGNLATGDSLVMQYNPEGLNEKLEAVFNELIIQGQSHPQLQYGSTKAHTFPSVKLSFDRLISQGPGGLRYDTAKARRWLLSIMYSSRASKDVASGAPPRILFVWPGLISMRCHVGSLELDNWRFGLDGKPTGFHATLEMKEVRDVRIYMEDVLASGTERPAVSNGSTDAGST